MTTENFHRRQAFLNARFAKQFDQHLADSTSFWSQNRPDADSPLEAEALARSSIASDAFERLVLHYTAGHPIESLRKELGEVIAAHVRYQQALGAHENNSEIAPLGLERLAEYERCMQLIGLCYLLHRRDLLPVIAQLEDPGYAGTDTLYEDLLAWELEGRLDVDQWFHDKPYRDLINSLYRDTDAQRLADLKAYCQAWYPAMRDTPWHDGHLGMTDTDGYYFGYWAFEAGAVAYLLDLDDAGIDHLVYPKDLVKFAREFKGSAAESAAALDQARVPGGDSCPRTGYWFTPAQAGSRQRFQQGEAMPDLQSRWGATIWQWDARQD